MNMLNDEELAAVNGGFSGDLSGCGGYIAGIMTVKSLTCLMYIAIEGGTLANVAQAFSVDVQKLASFNEISVSHIFSASERLFVPTEYLGS